MVSLIEHDLQKRILSSPLRLGLAIVILGPFVLWMIEFGYSIHDDKRLPYGLAFFQWARYLGDVFLSLTMIAAGSYYRKVRVKPSKWSGRSFSVLTILLGLALVVLFVIQEEINHSHPDELRWNILRVYHFFYFWWVSSLLFGATRLLRFGMIAGYERRLALIALILVLLYYGKLAVDVADTNPLWHYLREQYPEQTAYVESNEL